MKVVDKALFDYIGTKNGFKSICVNLDQIFSKLNPDS